MPDATSTQFRALLVKISDGQTSKRYVTCRMSFDVPGVTMTLTDNGLNGNGVKEFTLSYTPPFPKPLVSWSPGMASAPLALPPDYAPDHVLVNGVQLSLSGYEPLDNLVIC